MKMRTQAELQDQAVEELQIESGGKAPDPSSLLVQRRVLGLCWRQFRLALAEQVAGRPITDKAPPKKPSTTVADLQREITVEDVIAMQADLFPNWQMAIHPPYPGPNAPPPYNFWRLGLGHPSKKMVHAQGETVSVAWAHAVELMDRNEVPR